MKKGSSGRANDPWSGRRESNPRLTAWEAVTLPTELLPQHAHNAASYANEWAKHFCVKIGPFERVSTWSALDTDERFRFMVCLLGSHVLQFGSI
jgi:hypothetical protein